MKRRHGSGGAKVCHKIPLNNTETTISVHNGAAAVMTKLYIAAKC